MVNAKDIKEIKVHKGLALVHKDYRVQLDQKVHKALEVFKVQLVFKV
jgi:hypothetical protein